jgi:prophage tail gpP-like protein
MTLIVEGREIIIDSGKLLRTMDTIADAFTATVPWEPGFDPGLDYALRPFGYQDCQIYIGNDLEMDGVLYNVSQRKKNDGIIKELEIFSRTADLVDSSVSPPYEANNITLSDRCRQQCEPFGIDVEIGNGVDLTVPTLVAANRWLNYRRITDISDAQRLAMGRAGDIVVGQVYQTPSFRFRLNPDGTYSIDPLVQARREYRFPRVSAEQTDTIFEHLLKLAQQRGYLLSCTKHGNLLIVAPNIAGNPLGTIEDVNPMAESYEIKFTGRERWKYYRAIASSSRTGRAAAAGTAQDDVVTPPRKLTFTADDNLPGEAPNAAAWRKNKAAADALSIPFPVNSWYGPDGRLWMPNTRVTVVSDTIGLSDGFTFLISRVELKYAANGTTATLELKPPSAYSTDPEIQEPWLQ